jgi:hypothetical protein
MPIIPGTQVQIKRTAVRGQPGQKVKHHNSINKPGVGFRSVISATQEVYIGQPQSEVKCTKKY